MKLAYSIPKKFISQKNLIDSIIQKVPWVYLELTHLISIKSILRGRGFSTSDHVSPSFVCCAALPIGIKNQRFFPKIPFEC